MEKITTSIFSCYREALCIRGTQYRPEGDNLPIAVVSHGFMATQDTVKGYAKALARAGFAAFCFDFCGGSVIHGKSDGQTTQMSVLTEVQDLEAVLSYARGLSFTDENRVLLLGCSQGGFVSALTAAKKENKINRLALFYPALCIPDDARKGKMMFAKFDPAAIPETFSCGPMKLGRCYVQDVIGLDPYEQIVAFDGDVLLVHGTKDAIVPVSYSEKAFASYENRSTGSVQYVCIKNGTHGFIGRHDKQAVESLLSFALPMTERR